MTDKPNELLPMTTNPDDGLVEDMLPQLNRAVIRGQGLRLTANQVVAVASALPRLRDLEARVAVTDENVERYALALCEREADIRMLDSDGAARLWQVGRGRYSKEARTILTAINGGGNG